MPMSFRVPRVVDLFAGAGGLSEGFRTAGFQVLAGSDNDPDALATFRKNFPSATAILGDIRTPLVKEQILDAAKGAEVLVGGPPCQAFSQVRNHARLIDDPRNSLYREFVDAVSHILPTVFVMENVTGIDQMRIRDQIAADLSLNGEYNVIPQVLDAVDFGVPQSRRRLIFIGYRNGHGSPPAIIGTGASTALSLQRKTSTKKTKYTMMADATKLGTHLANRLMDPNDDSVVSASDAISDLRCLSAGAREDEVMYHRLGPASSAYQRKMRKLAGDTAVNVQVPRINKDTLLRLSAIPPGGNHRDLSESLLVRYISGDKWGQDNGSGLLSRKHFYAYRRLHPDAWSWTLNTKADSVYHYSVARALSVREFARLQSFPDTFQFTSDARKGMISGRHAGGPAHSRYRQVGNAVPPLLALAIARAVIETAKSDGIAEPKMRRKSA